MEANARRRGVIKRNQVRLEGSGARAHGAAEAASAPAQDGAPRVRLTRVDENTQLLELTCTCGEVSLIEIRTEKKP
jgi:hypothetical protein